VLTQYQTKTQQLLQYPKSPTTLYAASDITGWINTARGQLAGEAECVRYLGAILTAIGVRNYNFTSIDTGVSATTGIQSPLHVRSMRYAVASGYQWVAPRPWEWFELYDLNNPVPESGPPREWAQYGQGQTGSFFVDLLPDQIYTLTLDTVCVPIPLVDDSTVEAIPYPWTDAVPYFAAYLALLSAQMNARRADAEAYFGYYTVFVQRARQFSNPSLLRGNYEQSGDPTQQAKLGLQKQAGAA
jgi:hypothetical protein